MDKFFTPEFLATLSGSTIATRLVVEYSKDFIDQLTRKRVPTYFYALIVAYFFLYGASAVMGSLKDGMWFAHIANGFLVAVTAGAMEKTGK